MISPQAKQNNKQSEAEKVIKLLEKLDKAEKIEKIKQKQAEFSIPQSSPTQGTIEVRLPLSYRYLSGIQ